MGVIFFSGAKQKGNPENLLAMTLLRFLSLSLLLFSTVITAEPFWGAKASSPADTLLEDLKPGEFIWESNAEPSGPIVVIVSLPEQRAYVYRNGVRIGVSTASTGKKGHRSPTGVFTILNKDRHHHSKTYNNAAMPFSERLTWDGVALHAGGLPGYPSSHGCIHLPSVFAKDLFKITKKGMTVVIADEASAPRDVVHPSMLAPVDAGGTPVAEEHLSMREKYEWHPDKSPSGPVTILISSADKRVLVFRNGIEIGRARMNVVNPEIPLGTHAYMAVHGKHSGSTIDWKVISLHRHSNKGAGKHELQAIERVKISTRFVAKFKKLLTPGVTMMLTDEPVHQHTTGVHLNLVNAGFSGG
jgi:hypothetical protein